MTAKVQILKSSAFAFGSGCCGFRVCLSFQHINCLLPHIFLLSSARKPRMSSSLHHREGRLSFMVSCRLHWSATSSSLTSRASAGKCNRLAAPWRPKPYTILFGSLSMFLSFSLISRSSGSTMVSLIRRFVLFRNSQQIAIVSATAFSELQPGEALICTHEPRCTRRSYHSLAGRVECQIVFSRGH